MYAAALINALKAMLPDVSHPAEFDIFVAHIQRLTVPHRTAARVLHQSPQLAADGLKVPTTAALSGALGTALGATAVDSLMKMMLAPMLEGATSNFVAMVRVEPFF